MITEEDMQSQLNLLDSVLEVLNDDTTVTEKDLYEMIDRILLERNINSILNHCFNTAIATPGSDGPTREEVIYEMRKTMVMAPDTKTETNSG